MFKQSGTKQPKVLLSKCNEIDFIDERYLFLFKHFSKFFIPQSVTVKENKKGLSYGVTLNVVISYFQQNFTFTCCFVTYSYIFSGLSALRVIARGARYHLFWSGFCPLYTSGYCRFPCFPGIRYFLLKSI